MREIEDSAKLMREIEPACRFTCRRRGWQGFSEANA